MYRFSMKNNNNNNNNNNDMGLTGLANLGNTCYINSCIQIISHCVLLNKLVNNIVNKKLDQIDDSILLIEWKNLKQLMWTKNCTISPNRFIKSIQHVSNKKNLDLFSGYAQNDLPEFLIFIIDCFNNSIKRKVDINICGTEKNNTDKLAVECYKMIKEFYSENYSELLDIFYGTHVSIIENCLNNETLVNKPEPFCLLDLPIPKKNNITIYDCFDEYLAKELLTNNNKFYNEKTKEYIDVYKYILFWRLPNILIINLKRFDNNNNKINKLIDCPLTNINLTKYIVGYDKESYYYELFGITNHFGSSLGGHYTSYVKHSNSNKWYHFNDTLVTEINESKVNNENAYTFFLKKLNI